MWDFPRLSVRESHRTHCFSRQEGKLSFPNGSRKNAHQSMCVCALLYLPPANYAQPKVQDRRDHSFQTNRWGGEKVNGLFQRGLVLGLEELGGFVIL